MKAIVLKSVVIFLILAFVSCEKEDESVDTRLLGKWKLTEKTVDNAQVVLSDCEMQSSIEFREKNFCLLYDACAESTVNSGWNYKSEMLNISEYLPAAFYIEKLDKSILKISRNDISTDGNLQVTILSYSKIPE